MKTNQSTVVSELHPCEQFSLAVHKAFGREPLEINEDSLKKLIYHLGGRDRAIINYFNYYVHHLMDYRDYRRARLIFLYSDYYLNHEGDNYTSEVATEFLSLFLEVLKTDHRLEIKNENN